MKKVINITLGGLVFAIEQSAFDALEVYVGEIKQTLSAGDDVDEIVSDIETAMSEKFTERGRSEKIAITGDDVKEVVGQMGAPEDFGDEGAVGASEARTHTDRENNETKKKLYRDTDDVIVAGVASGVARYFDIDPVVVRIIFALSLLFNGIGFFIYVIFWLVVPAAKTTEEKYAMSGDKVTLKEIADRVKNNIEDIDKNDLEKATNLWTSFKKFAEKLFSLLGVFVKLLLSVLRYVIGFALLLAGALSIAGLVSAYSVILLSDTVLSPVEAQTALEILLSSSLGIIALTSLFIVVAIPLLVLIMAGGALLSKKVIFTIAKIITLLVVWIVALVLAITTSAIQADKIIGTVGPIQFNDGDFNVKINREDNNISIDIKETDIGSDTENSFDSKSLFGREVEIYDGLSYPKDSEVVSLAGKALTGSLKAEVRHLVLLKELNLSGNKFTGLPAEVGQLGKLEVLNLADNNFTGLPHELGNLSNLKTLDLQGNDISKSDLQIIRERLGSGVNVIE